MTRLPEALRWLFWETDFDQLEVEAHGDYVLPRILEHGRLVDVQWALATYGWERIHRFLREHGHPELSPRTIRFWRVVFEDEEPWASPPSWKSNSAAPWIG